MKNVQFTAQAMSMLAYILCAVDSNYFVSKSFKNILIFINKTQCKMNQNLKTL